MTQYMGELAAPAAKLSDKINITNTAMINLKLSPELKMKISKYVYNTHTTMTLQTDLGSFLEKIKPGFRTKVTKASFAGVIEMNYVMKMVTREELQKIMTYSQTMAVTSI